MSIADALKSVGIHQRDVDFDKAVALAVEKLIASGGTNEGALMRLQRIVERMSGMGQCGYAEDIGPARIAQTRHPLEDAGANARVPQGRIHGVPSSSSNRGGEGHSASAQSGQEYDALPVREPTPQQRLISARHARVVALTIMDTLKVDGRSMREWGVAEAERAGKAKTRDGYILRAAAASARSARAYLKGYEKLADVVPEQVFQRIKQKSEELADDAV